MKLYNRTPIDDGVLRRLLAKAARAVGAKHGKVLIEVGHGDNLRGEADDLIWKRIRKRKVTCEGWIHLTLPTRRIKSLEQAKTIMARVGRSVSGFWDLWYKGDPLNLAETIFTLARHEFVHVRDYQARNMVSRWFAPEGEWSRRGSGGRRPRWAERPEEQRAMAACQDADALNRGVEWAADEIIDLAIALDAIKGDA